MKVHRPSFYQLALSVFAMGWKLPQTEIPLDPVLLYGNSSAQEMETFQDGIKTDSPEIGSLEKQDPFGDESDAVVKYKTMAWWQAGMIMIAETISLGILALPKVLSTLGLFPGILVIIGIGILTTYTGFTIGQFKCRYVQVHSMADAGDILLGRLGREILGAAQLVFFIFIMGSHILTFSIMMNVLTEHSTCTIVFSVIGLLISVVLTLPRRLEDLSHLSTISFISIIGAVFTGIIGISATNATPEHIPLFSPQPTFHEAFIAIANVVFAYAGHVAFFTLFSELKDIREYPKALILLQTSEILLYTITAIVIYVFVGPSVASPALNSAGRLLRKISYGIAIPTIVIAGVVNAHVAVKFIYVRIFRGNNAMHTKSLMARSMWALVCAILWFLSWMIAESIPVFNDILGLASSLFASWFSLSLPGILWLHLNRETGSCSWKQKFLFGLNHMIVIIGILVCIFGLYSSIRSIHTNLANGVGGGSFSCADNS